MMPSTLSDIHQILLLIRSEGGGSPLNQIRLQETFIEIFSEEVYVIS